MVEVVNVVASGSLGIELDLEAIAGELDSIVDYDPDKYPGAYFRFGDSDPLITLYRTGKYIITGASSKEESARSWIRTPGIMYVLAIVRTAVHTSERAAVRAPEEPHMRTTVDPNGWTHTTASIRPDRRRSGRESPRPPRRGVTLTRGMPRR